MAIPAQVQDLIDGSGHAFHSKVARWFAANGWITTISPYYMDQSQQKAREVDLIAEKVTDIKGAFNQFEGQIAIRLFVECKFLPNYSVFWFTQKDQAAIQAMICNYGPFTEDNIHTQKHHYLAAGDRVAKLFASSNARGQEAEPFYKALNQTLNALVSLRERQPKVFLQGRKTGGKKLVLNFPVVVCSSFSQLYAADFDGSADTELVTDNFQLEVQYAYVAPSGSSHDQLFVLDMVEYDQLPQFSAAIDEDAQLAGFFASSA